MRALLGLFITLTQHPTAPQPLAVLYAEGMINVPTLYNAPTIAVYDNGLVIYQTATEPVKKFKSLVLTPDELASLVPAAEVAALFHGDTVPRGDTSRLGSDVEIYVLDLWRNTLHRRMTVRGDTSMGSASFAHIASRLLTYSSGRAVSWVPESIEIVLRPITHECAPTRPVAWPASLPHPTVLPDTLFRFLAPSKYLKQASEVLKKHGNWDCTPVLLGGKWWGFSYDFPYPAQSMWLRTGDALRAEPGMARRILERWHGDAIFIAPNGSIPNEDSVVAEIHDTLGGDAAEVLIEIIKGPNSYGLKSVAATVYARLGLPSSPLQEILGSSDLRDNGSVATASAAFRGLRELETRSVSAARAAYVRRAATLIVTDSAPQGLARELQGAILGLKVERNLGGVAARELLESDEVQLAMKWLVAHGYEVGR